MAHFALHGQVVILIKVQGRMENCRIVRVSAENTVSHHHVTPPLRLFPSVGVNSFTLKPSAQLVPPSRKDIRTLPSCISVVPSARI